MHKNFFRTYRKRTAAPLGKDWRVERGPYEVGLRIGSQDRGLFGATSADPSIQAGSS